MRRKGGTGGKQQDIRATICCSISIVLVKRGVSMRTTAHSEQWGGGGQLTSQRPLRELTGGPRGEHPGHGRTNCSIWTVLE